MRVIPLILITICFMQAKAGSLDDWVESNCGDKTSLPKNATKTEIRDAMMTCTDLLNDRVLLEQARNKLDEMKGSLSATNDKGVSSEQQKDEVDIKRMLTSERVFLLSVIGYEGDRTCELFYKGQSHPVKEGESFTGGKLISAGDGKAIIKTRSGSKNTLYLSTPEEIRVALGISAPDSRKKAVPLRFGLRQ